MVLHFFIFMVVLVFLMASRRLPFLTRRAVLWGVVYGDGIISS